MSTLNLQTFRFRCADGDIASAVAADEQIARAIVMEQRYGPPQFNRTWACTAWVGAGLVPVNEFGLAI